MISLIARKFSGGSVQKLIGSEREIKIQSFSMLRLLNGENRIQYWEFGIKMECGVRIRKTLQRLLLLTLKKYSLPPTRVRLALHDGGIRHVSKKVA